MTITEYFILWQNIKVLQRLLIFFTITSHNITRCMNNLEQELECTLFLRSNRGIVLTPEGEKLYKHVAIAYKQLSLAEEELRQDRTLENGIITIGASENALRLYC